MTQKNPVIVTQQAQSYIPLTGLVNGDRIMWASGTQIGWNRLPWLGEGVMMTDLESDATSQRDKLPLTGLING